jgi:zinc transport system substrate-binding protein
VTFLSAGGADPHDLELSPGDRALLETADVVLYMGDLDFQPQVERAVQDARGEVIDVRAVAGDEALIAFDDLGHDDVHGDDDHGHDDDHGEYDPHMWFDAALMADVVIEIGAAFGRIDAERAQAYEDNAAGLRDELLALDEELDALLSDCRFDTAIVSHEAYAYLLQPRGLAQEGISGAGGHGEASPQRIAELSARIQEEGIPALLAEPLHGRSDAEALASESGVELLTIDPLEIAGDEDFDRGYLELLREQGEQFATALDCRGGT